MKVPLVSLAILLIVLSAACSGKSKSPATNPTSTITVPASATRAPSAAVSTPVPRTKLAPENVIELKSEAQGTLSGLEGLSWSADSTQLLAYNRQAIAAVENKEAGTLKQIASVTAPEEIMDVAAVGTGSFVSRVDATHFNLRRMDNGSVIKTVQTDSQFSNVALSRDGQMAAVQRQDKVAADLYRLPEGTMLKQLTGFETAAPVYSVRFSPDNRSLIWLSRALVQIQDIASGSLGPQLKHEDFVSGLALRSMGNSIATGSGKSVFVWDSTTGASQQTLEQDGIVRGVAFSPDGSLMAVSSDAGFTLWDARDAATYVKINTVPGATREVAFAPDGTSLGTSNQDGQVSIWTRQGPTK